MNHREDQEPLITQTDTPDDTPTPAPAPTHPPSLGCCGRVCAVLRGITVEPVLFLYVFAIVMMVSVTTNLLLDKECLEMGYSVDICANITEHPTEEALVQQAVTTTRMYLSLITSLPAVIFALFLGSWSDKHGRLVPLILPLVGQVVSTLIFVANVFWMSLPSVYILFSGVPMGLSGGLTTLLMASFSYISDITKTNSRTTRIAFVDLGFSLGSPLGLLLGDLLYYKVGYLGVYGTGAGLFVIAILYVLIRIKDTRGGSVRGSCVASGNGDANGTVNGGVGGGGGAAEGQRGHRAKTMCLDLCDTENVRLSFATALKRRPHRGRAKVLALIAALCLMVAEFGGAGMDYLYTKRVFGWTYNQYVQLSVTQMLLGVVGAATTLPLLSYRLQVSDTVLVLAGCVSKILGLVMFALAPQPWFLYLSCVISLIGGFPLIITRSLISKVVPSDELGRIFSVLASAESVIPLAAGPLYTAVYNSSITVLPNAIYFLGAGLYTLTGLIVLCVFFTGTSSTTTTTTTSSSATTPAIRHIHADAVADIDA